MQILDYLRPLRHIIVYWSGGYTVHRWGSRYIRVLEVGANYATIGFEDLDARFYPSDWDYRNPVIRALLLHPYILLYTVRWDIHPPVYRSDIYWGYFPIFTAVAPGRPRVPEYALIHYTHGVIARGDFLRVITIAAATAIAAAKPVPAWGESMVAAGTRMTLYATAESPGLTVKIRIVKPSGTIVEDTMRDLGDGNYAYDFTFDEKGEYLIEVIYPDGFKRKKIVLAY